MFLTKEEIISALNRATIINGSGKSLVMVTVEDADAHDLEDVDRVLTEAFPGGEVDFVVTNMSLHPHIVRPPVDEEVLIVQLPGSDQTDRDQLLKVLIEKLGTDKVIVRY